MAKCSPSCVINAFAWLQEKPWYSYAVYSLLVEVYHTFLPHSTHRWWQNSLIIIIRTQWSVRLGTCSCGNGQNNCIHGNTEFLLIIIIIVIIVMIIIIIIINLHICSSLWSLYNLYMLITEIFYVYLLLHLLSHPLSWLLYNAKPLILCTERTCFIRACVCPM